MINPIKIINSKKQGFKLMAILILLTIGIVFVLGVYYIYSNKNNAKNQINFISKLDKKIRNKYWKGSSPVKNIKRINSSFLIKNNIIPQNKIHNNKIYSYIGNNVTNVHGITMRNNVYVLYDVSGIYKKQCLNYSKMALAKNQFDLLRISHGDYPNSIPGFASPKNQKNNKKAYKNLVEKCQSGNNNRVIIADNYVWEKVKNGNGIHGFTHK